MVVDPVQAAPGGQPVAPVRACGTGWCYGALITAVRLPHGSTARQQEPLRLVAAGHTHAAPADYARL
jgi:hypothetical protein